MGEIYLNQKYGKNRKILKSWKKYTMSKKFFDKKNFNNNFFR